MLYAKTQAAGGLVVPFHSLEVGASAPRRPPDRDPTVVVLHYTACPDLPRLIPAGRTRSLIDRASRAGTVSDHDAVGARLVCDSFVSGGVPDAIAQGAIAAASPREACGHFYVASLGAMLRPSVGINQVPVVEFVEPNRVAHHCGPLSGWVNRHSIGIEVCYPGPAPRKTCRTERQAREWFEARGWYPPSTWPPLPCADGARRWFAPFPPQVIGVVVGLIADLCIYYGSIDRVCAHSTFAPTKRIDPDPPLDLGRIAMDASDIVGRELYNTAPKR